MQSEEKNMGASVLRLTCRFTRFFCLLAATALLVIGCSVVLGNKESKVNPAGNKVEGNKVLSSSSWSHIGKDVVSGGGFSAGQAGQMPVQALSVDTSSELLSTLEQAGILGSSLKAEVPPLLIDSFPDDLAGLDVNSKKRVFFRSLLPVVMVSMEEVRLERERFQRLLQKIDGEPRNISFAEADFSWQQKLLPEEVSYILALTRKYRSMNAAHLLKKIDAVPVSLVLAQGAIESSWGTSRFASLGNNLFGMWTWGGQGIIPLKREDGKQHKVAAYNSILESVRAYILTINRLPAYKHLRELRVQTSDPIILAEGLLNYSERREAYVDDLQKIINHNRLRDFDRFSLIAI